MSGNTTVVLRQERGFSRAEADAHEQELRRLFVCGTIHEARQYAEDHNVLTVLARMTRREGTAIAELARQALSYPAASAELCSMVESAPSDERAASRIDAMFYVLASKGCDFGLQRVIVETMREWTNEPAGNRKQSVADAFFRTRRGMDRAAAEYAEERRRARAQWRPRSLDEELCIQLYRPDLGVPDFIDWMGDQPHDDYKLIMDLLRKGARKGHRCAARAQEILRHLEP